MHRAVAWFITEVERSLKGRLPQEVVNDIVAETHDHLDEMNMSETKLIIEKFGRPQQFAKSLLWARNKTGSILREGAPGLVASTIAIVLYVLMICFIDTVHASALVGWIAFILGTVVFFASYTARRSVVAPLLSAVMVGVIIGALTLGYVYTSPTGEAAPYGFAGRERRNGLTSPEAIANQRLVDVQEKTQGMSGILALAATGDLTKENLQTSDGQFLGGQVNIVNNGNPFVRYHLTESFEEARRSWESHPFIPTSLSREINDAETLAAARWTSIYEESVLDLSVSGAVALAVLLIGLIGNWFGCVVRKNLLWPRRRYA